MFTIRSLFRIATAAALVSIRPLSADCIAPVQASYDTLTVDDNQRPSSVQVTLTYVPPGYPSETVDVDTITRQEVLDTLSTLISTSPIITIGRIDSVISFIQLHDDTGTSIHAESVLVFIDTVVKNVYGIPSTPIADTSFWMVHTDGALVTGDDGSYSQYKKLTYINFYNGSGLSKSASSWIELTMVPKEPNGCETLPGGYYVNENGDIEWLGSQYLTVRGTPGLAVTMDEFLSLLTADSATPRARPAAAPSARVNAEDGRLVTLTGRRLSSRASAPAPGIYGTTSKPALLGVPRLGH